MITIIKHIRAILIEDIDIKKYLGTKIFARVAPVDTSLPFITLTRDSYKPDYTKNGIGSIDCSVSVFILTKDYANGVDIADKVASILLNKRIDEINVRDITIEDIEEDFDNEMNIFIQRIVLNIK